MASGSDNFNRNDEDLDASSDWEIVYDDGDLFAVRNGPVDGECVFIGSGINEYALARWAGTPPATDDYDIEADIRSSSASIGPGVAGRIPETGTGVANADGYFGGLFGGDLYYILELRDAGATENIIASGGAPGTTERAIRLNILDDDLELFVGGVSALTATNSVHVTGGVGLWVGSFLGGTTANHDLDNFQWSDLATGRQPRYGFTIFQVPGIV